jgi:hypothetical protein
MLLKRVSHWSKDTDCEILFILILTLLFIGTGCIQASFMIRNEKSTYI